MRRYTAVKMTICIYFLGLAMALIWFCQYADADAAGGAALCVDWLFIFTISSAVRAAWKRLPYLLVVIFGGLFWLSFAALSLVGCGAILTGVRFFSVAPRLGPVYFGLGGLSILACLAAWLFVSRPRNRIIPEEDS